MTSLKNISSTEGSLPVEANLTGWLDSLSLRPIRDPEDLPFLFSLYASAREEELSRTDWSETEKVDFLTLQFKLQHQYYQQHFPEAQFDIIQSTGHDIGRLYQNWGAKCLNLIDVVLLAGWRNQGIGSQILAVLQAEAARCGKGILLHVEPDNPALQLYQRIGFYIIAENGPYYKMFWHPSPIGQATTLGHS